MGADVGRTMKKEKESKVTLTEVAKRAGVSPSTVSRYLNRTSFIAKDKVRAIEEAMFESGFKSKPRKSQPITKRSMSIGVVAASFDSPHIARILKGMDSTVLNHSYQIIVETSHWNKARETEILKQFKQRNADAIVLIGSYLNDAELKTILGKTPVLLLGSPVYLAPTDSITGIPQVLVDNELGGYLATNHLIQLGHTRILHLRGAIGNNDSDERVVGYKRSLEKAGIEVLDELIVEGEFKSEQSLEVVKETIEQGIEFTAIFASNDESAYGAIQALHQKGYSVPDDISLIGFDDLPFSSYLIPQLTTVKQPLEIMGSIAIRYALDLISGIKPNYQVPPVEVIVRNSTQRNAVKSAI